MGKNFDEMIFDRTVIYRYDYCLRGMNSHLPWLGVHAQYQVCFVPGNCLVPSKSSNETSVKKLQQYDNSAESYFPLCYTPDGSRLPFVLSLSHSNIGRYLYFLVTKGNLTLLFFTRE